MNAAFRIPAQPSSSQIRSMAAPAQAGSIRVVLRVEAMIELALAVLVYRCVGGTWLIFAVLFLLPDISMVGYIASPRIGARMYNLGHTYIAPALLALAGVVMASPLLDSLALIWAAHIGFDRLLGYGLKYSTAFGATHLNGIEPGMAASGLQSGV